MDPALPSTSPPTFDPAAAQQNGSPIARLTLGHVALIVAVVGLVWALGTVFMLIFLAILLATSLRGSAEWVSAHTKLPAGLALTLVVVVVFGLIGGLFYWTGPSLYRELNDLGTRVVQEGARLRERFGDSPMIPDVDQLRSVAERVAASAAKIFGGSLSTLTELAVALVTALYFAGAPRAYVGGGIRLAPIRHRARLTEVVQVIAHSLRMWVLGQLISMLAVGIIASVGLWFAGVPVPFALGVIAGLFTFVPYVGTIVSGALAVLIALSVDASTAVWALGVFTLCHLVEGYVVAPLVQRRILDLPPALTLLSMTVLGSLFGLPGIILGTPLAAVVLILVQSLYVGDVLGDHEVDPTRKR